MYDLRYLTFYIEFRRIACVSKRRRKPASLTSKKENGGENMCITEDKLVLVNTDILDDYLETFHIITNYS